MRSIQVKEVDNRGEESKLPNGIKKNGEEKKEEKERKETKKDSDQFNQIETPTVARRKVIVHASTQGGKYAIGLNQRGVDTTTLTDECQTSEWSIGLVSRLSLHHVTNGPTCK